MSAVQPVQPSRKSGYKICLNRLRPDGAQVLTGPDESSDGSQDVDYSGTCPCARAGGPLRGVDVAFAESWYSRLAAAESRPSAWIGEDGAVHALSLPSPAPDSRNRMLSGRRLRFLRYMVSRACHAPPADASVPALYVLVSDTGQSDSDSDGFWDAGGGSSSDELPELPGAAPPFGPPYLFPSAPPYTPYPGPWPESSDADPLTWFTAVSSPPSPDESDGETPFLGRRDVPEPESESDPDPVEWLVTGAAEMGLRGGPVPDQWSADVGGVTWALVRTSAFWRFGTVDGYDTVEVGDVGQDADSLEFSVDGDAYYLERVARPVRPPPREPLFPSPLAAAPVRELVSGIASAPSSVWSDFPSPLADLSGSYWMTAKAVISEASRDARDAELAALREAASSAYGGLGDWCDAAWNAYMDEHPVPPAYDAVRWHEWVGTETGQVTRYDGAVYQAAGWLVDYRAPDDPPDSISSVDQTVSPSYVWSPVNYTESPRGEASPSGVAFSDVNPQRVAGSVNYRHVPGGVPKGGPDSARIRPVMEVSVQLVQRAPGEGLEWSRTRVRTWVGYVLYPRSFEYSRDEGESSGDVDGACMETPSEYASFARAAVEAVFGTSSPYQMVVLPEAVIEDREPRQFQCGEGGELVTYVPKGYRYVYGGPTDVEVAVSWHPVACILESGYCVP